MSVVTRFKAYRRRVVAVAIAFAGSLTLHSADAANGSVTYTYDALGRVVTALYDTGACIAYTYDAVGNRLSETILVPSPTGTGIWDCSSWNSATWGP
jgi:hypothetical protein